MQIAIHRPKKIEARSKEMVRGAYIEITFDNDGELTIFHEDLVKLARLAQAINEIFND